MNEVVGFNVEKTSSINQKPVTLISYNIFI